MGRHASPEPADEPERRAHPLGVWMERVLLGLAAGAGIFGVLVWAGTSWTGAVWVAAAIVVIVPAAAWLASTVPGSEHRR